MTGSGVAVESRRLSERDKQEIREWFSKFRRGGDQGNYPQANLTESYIEALEGEAQRLRDEEERLTKLVSHYGALWESEKARAEAAEARIHRVKEWIMSHVPLGLHPEYNELLKALGGEE